MNVRDTMKEKLSENGYDGLYSNFAGCGCEVDDLMPCEYDQGNCEPGYKVQCPGDGECECDPNDPHAWHIQKEKK